MTNHNEEEIEKKYRVNSIDWKESNNVLDFQNIYQGYFVDSDGRNKRVRVITNQNKAFVTEKVDLGVINGFSVRKEIENSIDYRKGLEIILGCKLVIAKDRTVLPLDIFKIEVDVFKNLPFDLTVSEVEVKRNETEYFNKLSLPEWFGEDLSESKEFSNFNLLNKVDMTKMDVDFNALLTGLNHRKKI